MDKIIFFRAAWMRNYAGLDNDEINTFASWVVDHGFCHEMYNFKNWNGKFLGFVEPKGSIRIERLDGRIRSTDDSVDNVTVIWVGPSPNGGTFVIGWYLDATVYRKEQEPPNFSDRYHQGTPIYYNVKTYVHNGVLLPIEERIIPVPTGKGGIGQSNIWYADDKSNINHKNFRDSISKYISDYYDFNSTQCVCGAKFPVTTFSIGQEMICQGCSMKVSVPQTEIRYPDPQITEVVPLQKDQILSQANTPKESLSQQKEETQTEVQTTVPKKEEKSADIIYEEILPAVVAITNETGSGSGFFVDNNGLIVTNRHVIESSSFVDVKLHNNTVCVGKVLKFYRDIDLAFVKIDAHTPDYIPINESPDIRVGYRVFAIGHPLGIDEVITDGIVSKLEQWVNEKAYMLISTSIEPGSSGGPLLNKFGELVGINTMGRTDATVMNFAIPIDQIRSKYEAIKNRTNYLSLNHFCSVCGNTSFNKTWCDHCGVEISLENKASVINSDFTVKCQNCQTVSDDNVSFCPNCGFTIK